MTCQHIGHLLVRVVWGADTVAGQGGTQVVARLTYEPVVVTQGVEDEVQKVQVDELEERIPTSLDDGL